MPTAQSSIAQLERFLDHPNIPSIIERLSQLNMNEGSVDKIIESLRKDLLTIVSTENEDLRKVAYNTLLALAESYPANDVDPITLNQISQERRVVISTGQQFDLYELIDFHNRRNYRSTTESIDGKALIDPFTNQAFSDDDNIHIRTVAAQREIIIMNDVMRQFDNSERETPGRPEFDLDTLGSAIDLGSAEAELSPERNAFLRRNPLWIGILISGNYLTVDRAHALTDEQIEHLTTGNILDLIFEDHLTVDVALTLTDEQREQITKQEIFQLIRLNHLTVERAIALTVEQREHLTTPNIFRLIMDNHLTVDRALTVTAEQYDESPGRPDDDNYVMPTRQTSPEIHPAESPRQHERESVMEPQERAEQPQEQDIMPKQRSPEIQRFYEQFYSSGLEGQPGPLDFLDEIEDVMEPQERTEEPQEQTEEANTLERTLPTMISNLIMMNHLTLDRARALSDEQIEHLTTPMIFQLIRVHQLTVDGALALTDEQREQLTTQEIFQLIRTCQLTVDNALALTDEQREHLAKQEIFQLIDKRDLTVDEALSQLQPKPEV